MRPDPRRPARRRSPHRFPGSAIVSRPEPAALVVAGPGTNRDTDAVLALDLAGAEPWSCSPASWPPPRAARRPPASSSSPAASATATPSAPAACSPSTSPRPTAAGSASALRVRRRRPPGHRHLQRLPGAHPAGLLPGRARPQRRRALRLPLGRARPEPASRCIWTGRLDDEVHCPIAHGEGRYVHPDPDGARRRRPGGPALRRRQPQRVRGRHRRRVRRHRRRARPDAPPGEPRAPAPAPPHRARPRHPGTSGCACSKRRCAMSTWLPMRAVRRRRPAAPDRRDGKVRVSYALGDDRRLFVTTDRLSAFDRIVAGVPYKGQVLNQLAAWWFDRTADVVANHVVAVPDPNVLVAGRPRRCRSRSSCAATSPASRRRRCGGRTPPAPARSTATTSPTGWRRTPPCPSRSITPTTKPPAGSAVHDEPLTWAEVVERGLVEPRPLGAGHGGRPGAVPPRPGGRRRRRADPRRHEVRVRARRRRAAADRRGAHARLVALLGRRHVRRAAGRRRGARRASTRRSSAGPSPTPATAATATCPSCPPTCGRRHVDPLHRRLRTAHRRARSSPGPTPSASDRLPPRPSTRTCEEPPVTHHRPHPRGVRRARHLDAARRGRRPADVLRPVRAAAPRPGGRRHRRQRRPPGPRAQAGRASCPTCSPTRR